MLTGNELAIRYHNNPTSENKEALFRGYSALIESIAKKYIELDEFDDLVGAGYLGLCLAIDRFDPSVSKFTTIAFRYISGSILNHIRDNTQKIKIPNHWYDAVRKYSKRYLFITENLSIDLSVEDISKELQCPVDLATFIKRHFDHPQRYISMDSSDSDEQDDSTIKRIVYENHPHYSESFYQEVFNNVKYLIETGATTSKIARELNVSFDEARQLKAKCSEYLTLCK